METDMYTEEQEEGNSNDLNLLVIKASFRKR